MRPRLTAVAAVSAALMLTLAGPSAAGAATPVNGKWRGVNTHWMTNGEWHKYTGAAARRWPLSFWVAGPKKNKRMTVFNAKAFRFQCPKQGANVTVPVHPTILGVTPERIKLTRKGQFEALVDTLIDVPFQIVDADGIASNLANLRIWIKGRFTSPRTARGYLLTAVEGCDSYTFEAWSASVPKPKHKPKDMAKKPKPAPTTPGVNDGGGVYGCRLIWCGPTLPTPYIPPLW